jgi:P2 family prophage PSPPH06, major capsid protein
VMSGKKIGGITGHDYKNIDAAVYDAAHELIEPWYQDGDLVLIAGRKLITDKYLALIGNSDAPTERNALEKLMVSQLFGGLRTLSVPFFPDDAFLITPLSNLSIYTQRNTTRLAYLDNPRKDRIEEYRSLNEAYVIEDYDACCLVEGILVPKADGSGWE